MMGKQHINGSGTVKINKINIKLKIKHLIIIAMEIRKVFSEKNHRSQKCVFDMTLKMLTGSNMYISFQFQ